VRAGENARWERFDPATEVEWRNGTPAPATYWEAEDNPDDVLSPNSFGR
jgi:hypothetical protein